MGIQKFLDHTKFRLATGAVLAFEMRAEKHRFEFDSLRAEQIQNKALRDVEGLARKARCPQPVLIGDYHKSEAGAFQFQQRRNDAGHQADLCQAVYLLVRDLFVQCAVAIEEQDASRAHATPTQRSNVSFCARVPTETRNECGSAGWARRSRTIKPPAMLLCMNRSASGQSMSRKLASLGH